MTSAQTRTPFDKAGPELVEGLRARETSAALLEVRRAGTRFRTVTDGTDTWHSFSFGAHYDPDNVGFGALTVHNEDRVREGRGYPEHLHRDAEIVTWVLSGSLAHADSTGHRGVVRRGLVQRLSAGSGVRHIERTAADAVDPAHFLQMWVRPDVSGGAPAYAQAEISADDLAQQWVPVVSGHRPDAAVRLASAGSTLWGSTLAPAEQRTLPEAERLHVFVARGAVDVEGVGELEVGDAVRVEGETGRLVIALADAELLVWELGR